MGFIREGIKCNRNLVISVPDLNHSSSTYQGNFSLLQSMSFLFNNFMPHFTTRKLSTVTRKSFFWKAWKTWLQILLLCLSEEENRKAL